MSGISGSVHLLASVFEQASSWGIAAAVRCRHKLLGCWAVQ